MFKKVAREELKVPARIEYLADLREFVVRVGKKYGVPDRIINAFKLSIDEAATNIIKHAYRDWSGDITLRAIAKKDTLTMVLVDQGKYFDPRQVSEPDLQRYVEIGKKGGLGIFIMRRLLDEIDYRKTEEGNELWMVKHLAEARKKRKIAIPAIPLTLKMRYWLYSLAVFTVVLFAVTVVKYFQSKNRIFEDYINRGRSACSFLAGQISSNWAQVDPEVIRELAMIGSYDIEIRAGADEAIRTLVNTEHKQDIRRVFLTDRRGVVLACSDSIFSVWEERFSLPEGAITIRRFEDSEVYLITDKHGTSLLDIIWPISAEDGTHLADAHLIIDYRRISRHIAQYTITLASETLILWLVASAGLFGLIYVVMNPFKRLQEWVKRLGEPGAAEEMDIDSSSEIGAIAQAFSDITIQLKKSQAHLVEQERLQQEMHIAKQIQQTLLPSEFPELDGYEIAAYYAAAKEVGGDFYDFVEVDKDTVGVAVADVSGKGVPGAFVMTMIRTALRSEARGVKDAAEVLAKVNDFVVNDMKKGMFVTLLYVIIDSKRRRINFASAGHNPLILHRPGKNKTYYLNPRGFPIGISLPDKDLFRRSIESDTISLAEDDIILVYTDGVTEAMNPKRRLFGEERFLDVIRECGGKTAQEFIETLKKELNSFTEGNEQNDDITVVAIKEKLSAERAEFHRAAKVYELVKRGVGIKEACKEAGISVYAYYQKFKGKFDEGVENYVFAEELDDQVEAKHLSIEEKNKIYDIIRRNPEFGAKRIAEEMNSERYGFVQIPASRIYEELVRMRLNTKELREAFVQRGGKRRRIKPPGTPLLTIDGRVILNREQIEEEEIEPVIEKEKPKETVPLVKEAALPSAEIREEEVQAISVFDIDKSVLLTAPLEDVLDKRAALVEAEETVEKAEEAPMEMAAETIDEKKAVSPPTIGQGKKSIRKEKTLDEESALPPSESTVEEELFFGGESDLELLAFEFGREPESSDLEPFEEMTKEEETASGSALFDGKEEPKTETEEFDWPTLEEYQAREEWAEEAKTADTGFVEESKPTLKADELSTDLLVTDDLFELWALEAEKKTDLEHQDDRAYFWNEMEEEAKFFEEIFIDETETTIFGIEEQFEFADSTDHDSIMVVSANNEGFDEESKAETEQVVKLVDHNEDSVFTSLDKIVSIESSEEPLIAQKDEEFDRLLEDAASSASGHQLSKAPKRPIETGEKSTLEIAYYAALAAYQEKRYREAVQILGTLPMRFTHDRKLQMLYGNASYRCGCFTDAVNAFQRVLLSNPEDEQACENIAASYANLGELKKAIYYWERLLFITPRRQDIRIRLVKAKELSANFSS